MPVPGDRHERVGANQQNDGQHGSSLNFIAGRWVKSLVIYQLFRPKSTLKSDVSVRSKNNLYSSEMLRKGNIFFRRAC